MKTYTKRDIKYACIEVLGINTGERVSDLIFNVLDRSLKL